MESRPNVYTNKKSRQVGPEEEHVCVDLKAIHSVFNLVQKPCLSAFIKLYPFLSKHGQRKKIRKKECALSLPQLIISRVLNVFCENHLFMYVRLIIETVRSFFSNFQFWKLKWSSQKYNQGRNRRMSVTSVHLVKTLWQAIYSQTDGSRYFHIGSFHPSHTKTHKYS